MARFYTAPDEGYTGGFEFEPNWKLGSEVLLNKDKQVKDLFAGLDNLKLPKFNYLDWNPEEVEAARAYYEQANKIIQETTKNVMANWKNPTLAARAIGEAGRWIQEQNTIGTPANLQESYDRFNAWKADNDKITKEDRIFGEAQENYYKNQWLQQTAGKGGSNFSRFQGGAVLAAKNPFEEYAGSEAFQALEATEITRGWSAVSGQDGLYIKDGKTVNKDLVFNTIKDNFESWINASPEMKNQMIVQQRIDGTNYFVEDKNGNLKLNLVGNPNAGSFIDKFINSLVRKSSSYEEKLRGNDMWEAGRKLAEEKAQLYNFEDNSELVLLKNPQFKKGFDAIQDEFIQKFNPFDLQAAREEARRLLGLPFDRTLTKEEVKSYNRKIDELRNNHSAKYWGNDAKNIAEQDKVLQKMQGKLREITNPKEREYFKSLIKKYQDQRDNLADISQASWKAYVDYYGEEKALQLKAATIASFYGDGKGNSPAFTKVGNIDFAGNGDMIDENGKSYSDSKTKPISLNDFNKGIKGYIVNGKPYYFFMTGKTSNETLDKSSIKVTPAVKRNHNGKYFYDPTDFNGGTTYVSGKLEGIPIEKDGDKWIYNGKPYSSMELEKELDPYTGNKSSSTLPKVQTQQINFTFNVNQEYGGSANNIEEIINGK